MPASRVSVAKSTELTNQALDLPPSSQVAAPDTPPANHPPTSSHRKGGRPPNSRKGKLGKNQYTKDRDLQDNDDQSPGRSQSRDIVRIEENGHPSGAKSSTSEGKHGRSKASSSKITMSDMKKRATGLLEFISRTQVDMAKESFGGEVDRETKNLPADGTDSAPQITIGEENSFEDLSCLDMMDVLAKRLIKWQNEFG